MRESDQVHGNHGSGATAISSDKRTIALVGNPNVGKSVVFGYLTGRYVNVSNYPGTTVEITTGKLSGDHGDWEVIDTPGINNFIPSSEDEVVTRNILMEQNPTNILQVVDTKNLRRGLLLSLQLGEMGRPYVLCLNMADEARAIWDAMRSVFGQGYTTPDLRDPEGALELIGTEEFGGKVLAQL
ncbi:MAG: 50S ribosome-binding GTPase [Candidatus Marinimicrobia bacterium]|nr:50S ribosome-binding GTPase [Candidatus Neomarinimicrobiota bacterium]